MVFGGALRYAARFTSPPWSAPNRNSPPAVLLREGWREGKKFLGACLPDSQPKRQWNRRFRYSLNSNFRLEPIGVRLTERIAV